MSLINDFANYYVNTYVALQEGDVNHPLYIMEVDQNGEFSRHDFSREAEQALVFVGQKWFKDSQGRYRHEIIRIPVFDPRIIHESPDVGYLNHGQNFVSWTHINPVRQRVKGLMGNKIRQLNSPRGINGQMVYNLFNPEFDGLITRYIFINPFTGDVHYKGARVGVAELTGTLVRGRLPLRLLSMFKHIAEDFEHYNVTLVDSL